MHSRLMITLLLCEWCLAYHLVVGVRVVPASYGLSVVLRITMHAAALRFHVLEQLWRSQ